MASTKGESLTKGFASRWRLLVLTVLVLNAVASSALASRRGPGVSSDSVFYASAARSFAVTGEFTTHLGAPLTAWPPGLSTILGIGIRAGFGLEGFATCLNLLCVGLLVLLTYLLGEQTLRSPYLALLCAALVSGSASTVRVFSMLWTEPIFTVLTMTALLFLTRSVRLGQVARRHVVIIATAISMATTVRFVGAALIPIAGLGTVAGLRAHSRHRALAGGLLVGGFASVGLVVVVARNLAVSGTATSPRGPMGHSLRSVFFASLDDLGQYANAVPLFGTTKMGLFLAVMLCGSVATVCLRRDLNFCVLAAFAVVYWLFLWYSSVFAGIDPPNERLSTPVFAPMVILWTYAARELWTWFSSVRRFAAARWAVASLVVLWGATTVVDAWAQAAAAGRTGIGHNSSESLNSPLAAALRSLPPGVGIASNDANLAYWVGERSPILQTPREGFVYGALGYLSLEEFTHRVQDGSVDYVAFFDANTRGVATAPELVRDGVPIGLLRRFRDGSLWQPCAHAVPDPATSLKKIPSAAC